ncbi:MAG: phospholipase D-like domain-containing protein [Actinomycetota bacterium]|nr:phospholipase D-like domain-containing protein [Actinomycetota bacterium]
MDEDPALWFLDRAAGDSPAFADHRTAPESQSWSEGNLVRPLVHGATYFARLFEELTALKAGDRVWFTDWRGDADERLRAEGPPIGDLLAGLAHAGIEVRGLVWRSHGERVSSPMSGRSNELLGRQINDAGGEVLLDQRVRVFGSHHQKLFVIRHRDEPARDVAFVGGIDLSHSRRDDAEHAGDPQVITMNPRYGERPAWHDAALELHGPVVVDLLAVFAERWNDPDPLDRRTPYRMLLQRLAHMPRHPKPLPVVAPPPPPAGPHAVQVLRTYGVKHPPFPFAPDGERSIARAYEKAFARARSFIYIEDQYLWSREVAAVFARALERNPELQLIAVVPRYPDADGALAGPPIRIGQLRAIEMLRRVAPGRVGIFDLENSTGSPIYVHAKICIIDDTWFTCGSDNFNRRSWTTDSELTCAVIDHASGRLEGGDMGVDGHEPGGLARDLRMQLWAEHLGLRADDPVLGNPAAGLDLWTVRAEALDGWHASGQRRPRPNGRVRRHETEPVSSIQRLWAVPMSRLVIDPDGRPRRLRVRNQF